MMSDPTGEGTTPENNSGDGNPPENQNPNGDKNDSELVKENKKYRERAQTAEKTLAEKETQYTELQSNYEKLQGGFGELTKKVETFEFNDNKRAAVKEFVSSVPDGHGISDMELLEAHVSKLSNPETLKADIEEFGKKLIVEGPQGTKLSFAKTPAPQTNDMKIDFNNPAAMAKAYDQNPQAFRESVAKANQVTAQGFNISAMPGMPAKQ